MSKFYILFGCFLFTYFFLKCRFQTLYFALLFFKSFYSAPLFKSFHFRGLCFLKLYFIFQLLQIILFRNAFLLSFIVLNPLLFKFLFVINLFPGPFFFEVAQIFQMTFFEFPMFSFNKNIFSSNIFSLIAEIIIYYDIN